MDLRKLKTLIDLVSESNVSELEITALSRAAVRWSSSTHRPRHPWHQRPPSRPLHRLQSFRHPPNPPVMS